MRFCLLPLLALTLTAQTPSFEVASVRLANSLITPPPLCGSLTLSPDSVLVSGVKRLDNLIEEAFKDGVDDIDNPLWARYVGSFAVSARVPPNTSVETCHRMLQNLLAERFRMVTEVETRDVDRYFLKVGKSGLKLKPVAAPPADSSASHRFNVDDGRVRHTFRGASMSLISRVITGAIYEDIRGHGTYNVVPRAFDETGLTGYYDGELDLEIPYPSRLAQSPLPETVQDAVARQLGLALELRKAPGKVLVIRSSDRTPTEN